MLILFAVVAVADLIAVAWGIEWLEWVAKPLLCLVLAAYVLRTAPRQRLLATGLVFATAGDVALLVDGQVAFLVGMTAFLVMQICYIVVFVRLGSRPRLAAVAYLLVWAAAAVTLWQPLGGLAAPVLAYGLVLVAMAAFAAGVNAVAGIGGALFVFSDFLVGLGVTGADFSGRGVALMTTYILAQFLIVRGVLRATPPPQPA
ncbi:lysoplasmalogenase [Nonomuraea sp. MCN248]|uniref:Lysoplasmalogenase n=1 Tax=Nonomuraea corallina TaxID=2989783 RepID=A0ABT4SDR7_9ACTN|nr:lysoplasmalogenase [Nonomuraea corallina]MDA0635290.1 lysoplasmalogenase [Nonomuraea corallina]